MINDNRMFCSPFATQLQNSWHGLQRAHRQMESPGERKQSMAMGAETETTANDGGGSVGGGGGNSAISVTVGDDANRTEDDGETKMPSVTESTIDNPAVDCRNMRRIIAEDPEWSLATVPLLTELCTEHMVKNFESE